MIAATIARPHSAAEARPDEFPDRRLLLVATDGSASADAAICAAHAIAARTGQPVAVIAVHALIPTAVTEVGIVTLPAADAEARAKLHDRVAAQVRRLRVGGDWPLEVVTGDPAESIAQAARATGAALIVMGIGRHGIASRLFGEELVLSVLRLSDVPVFAASPHFLGLPKRVIAATDFSASSVRALRAASSLMLPGGTMSIVHVESHDHQVHKQTVGRLVNGDPVARAFDRVLTDLDIGCDITVRRSVLTGDPAKQLLRLARSSGTELLAAGSRGHNGLTRLLLGSVSTRLVREAPCSVLVAPPLAMDGPDFIEAQSSTTTAYGS